MANEVLTLIKISTKNREIINKLKKTFDQDLTDIKKFYRAIYHPNLMIDDELDSINYDNYIDDIGSKWCYLSRFEINEKTISISLVSADSFPNEAFKQIYRLIHYMEPDILVYCTYTEENFNFIGSAAYGPRGYHQTQENNLSKCPNKDDFYDDNDYKKAFISWETNLDEELLNLKDICIETVN